MDEVTLRQQFLALSATEQVYLLAWWSHNLTVAARAEYVPDGPTDPTNSVRRLIAFNELQHQLSAQLGHLLDDSTRYPDDVFITGVLERAQRGQCLPEVVWAFQQVAPR